jgi:hypothetical protein
MAFPAVARPVSAGRYAGESERYLCAPDTRTAPFWTTVQPPCGEIPNSYGLDFPGESWILCQDLTEPIT